MDPTEAEVRALAEKAAREAGYDLSVYSIKDASPQRSRSPDPSWMVFFEHAPPTPPGGHFMVFVDPETKTARVMPGE